MFFSIAVGNWPKNEGEPVEEDENLPALRQRIAMCCKQYIGCLIFLFVCLPMLLNLPILFHDSP